MMQQIDFISFLLFISHFSSKKNYNFLFKPCFFGFKFSTSKWLEEILGMIITSEIK